MHKAENETLLRNWVNSHTPEQIRLANNARVLLKKMTGRSYGNQLQDDRIPKRVRSEMALFAQDRWASGDLKGVKVTDAAKLLRREFLELSEVERKVSVALSVPQRSQLIFCRYTGIAQLPIGRDTYGSTRRRSIATLTSSKRHELLDFEGLFLHGTCLYQATQAGSAWREAKGWGICLWVPEKGVYR